MTGVRSSRCSRSTSWTKTFPTAQWDLIHERLVLVHIPRRLEVLDRLVEALAPGGWIVLEDFDTGEVRSIDREGPTTSSSFGCSGSSTRCSGQRGAANGFGAKAIRYPP